MKIGTDAVLLGAWAKVSGCQQFLDIGTGSGLVALMLAQRTEVTLASIHGIDIDPGATEQAKNNAANSPWANRIRMSAVSLQNFSVEADFDGYDHCVCNPPYFNSSFPSSDLRRKAARQDHRLDRKTLFRCSKDLLKTDGRLSLILPYEQRESIIQLACETGFFLSRQTLVRPMPIKPFKRMLIEFVLREVVPRFDELTIEETRHEFTDEYEALTRQFHLRFAGKREP
jgi:tRNA1Val (adenine37-N6)-methyltransferase